VRGFARLAGSVVRIESVKGVGTAVFLYLTRLPAEELIAQAELPMPLRAARPGETVLVVDDEPIMLEMAAGALESLGYRILEAGSAQDALAILQGNEVNRLPVLGCRPARRHEGR
jgi:hypothetical protein